MTLSRKLLVGSACDSGAIMNKASNPDKQQTLPKKVSNRFVLLFTIDFISRPALNGSIYNYVYLKVFAICIWGIFPIGIQIDPIGFMRCFFVLLHGKIISLHLKLHHHELLKLLYLGNVLSSDHVGDL